MTLFLPACRSSSLVLVQVSQHFQGRSASSALILSDVLQRRKMQPSSRGSLTAPADTSFLLISACKWMRISMRGAICGAEYSCGRRAGCPRPGRQEPRSSRPHYSDVLTKSNKAKKQGDSKVRIWPQVHRKLPDSGNRERGKKHTLSHTHTHTFAAVGADALRKNPAYLRGASCRRSDRRRCSVLA